jgi:DNA recombination protein RmuC
MTNSDLFLLAGLVWVLLGVFILVRMGQLSRILPDILRAEARESREELGRTIAANVQASEARLSSLETALTGRFTDFGKAQSDQMADLRREASAGRETLEAAVQRNADSFAKAQAERLKDMTDTVDKLATTLATAQAAARDEQKQGLQLVTDKVGQLMASNAEKQDQLKEAISASLDKVRKDNELKLEQMRATVEEKLEGTLEKRLGASFQQVSERLEQVHRGLGEMQTLATGVGDLKRVFSNVKARGGWGEIQLGMLLSDMLTPDQYGANVRLKPGSQECVEFAVRLPGRNDEGEVWLPIDAKFPQEDYDRLLLAQDEGRADEIEKAGQALERAIKLQAKTIAAKYLIPPTTTEFAILYLPTEGLYAEVIRRPGLVSELQSKFRIVVQGPTTLGALLNALQMGFRTLAIEKRSSEVWKVLGEAKAEFEKYGQVWDKLGKQLDTARRTVDEAGKRTRAVTRSLKTVEILDAAKGPALLELVAPDLLDDDGENDDAELADDAA